MSRLPRSTIEQWAVLRTVIEQGGFAQAAAFLHRSQSSVSYAVTRLQDALGGGLLEVRGRRSVLTEAGAALLAEAIPLIDELLRLEERGQAILRGEVVRIRLLIDALFPKPRLFDALKTLAEHHPHAEVHLRETVRRTVADLGDPDFDLAVLATEPGARYAELVANVVLIAVARNGHALTRLRQPPNRLTMAQHLRVEIRGVEMVDGPRAAEAEGKVWRMNTVEAAIEAVRRGLCYGWLPRHLIEADLDAGVLVPLSLATDEMRHIPLCLRYRDEGGRVTPAIRMLARLLAADGQSGLEASAPPDQPP